MNQHFNWFFNSFWISIELSTKYKPTFQFCLSCHLICGIDVSPTASPSIVDAKSRRRVQSHAGLALASVAAVGVDAFTVGTKVWIEIKMCFIFYNGFLQNVMIYFMSLHNWVVTIAKYNISNLSMPVWDFVNLIT